MREHKKLLADCRKTKNGAEEETMDAVVEALRTMESPIIARLKRKRELDFALRYLQKKPTPQQNLDWMTKQLESLIAEFAEPESQSRGRAHRRNQD